ncbi:MAG: hypothetical protein AB1424_01780 [Thermodesulfobacteriota bacterium]
MKKPLEAENLLREFQPYAILPALQATIRRYSWQSVVVRLAAVAVVAWFFAHIPMGSINPYKPTIIGWPLVCLLLLWIWEGHIKFMQAKYCEMYEAASQGQEVHLTFPAPKGFNVSGLWVPTVVLHYTVLIGLCFLARWL